MILAKWRLKHLDFFREVLQANQEMGKQVQRPSTASRTNDVEWDMCLEKAMASQEKDLDNKQVSTKLDILAYPGS